VGNIFLQGQMALLPPPLLLVSLEPPLLPARQPPSHPIHSRGPRRIFCAQQLRRLLKSEKSRNLPITKVSGTHKPKKNFVSRSSQRI
jgi:hypothetical protein